jgi:cobaltochelatase CobS
MLRQNIAFQDRFTMVKADYPTADVEEAVLTRMFPNIPQEIVQKMVKFANHMRKLFVGDASGGVDEQIELTCSTRTLIRWAYLIQAYDPMRQRGVDVVGYALDRALVFRAQGATISTLNELYQRVF